MIVQPKERAVEVVRSFVHRGNDVKVGARLTLPNDFAHEMRHAGKVVFVDGDPKPIEVKPAPPAPNAIPAATPRAESDKKGK